MASATQAAHSKAMAAQTLTEHKAYISEHVLGAEHAAVSLCTSSDYEQCLQVRDAKTHLHFPPCAACVHTRRCAVPT